MTPHRDDIDSLHSGFLRSCTGFPDRPALEVDGNVLTYAELCDRAAAIAASLQRDPPTATPKLVGIFANRSTPVYSGILGTLMAGYGVVPLNPTFPAERTRQMIDQAELGAIVLDAKGEAQLDEILAGVDRPLLLLMPQVAGATALETRWPRHKFLTASRMSRATGWNQVAVNPDATACLFFTSGSTGIPKGVGVTHANASRFVAMSVERYRECGLSENDRFSQFYDITFDSSMFDLYISWAFGAALCCPTAAEWINPNKFILEKRLTVIDIVPSAGHAMNRSNGWRPGRFPGLRLCRFGGEALSADLAAALAAAAPNAVVENVYGPTECTVDACYYRWDATRSPAECEHGMVPIGAAGPRVGLRIVDDELHEVPIGGQGELLISGPQVTPGYWRNPERTRTSFITVPGTDAIHYRTGDLVRRPPAGKPIIFLGRMDHQIKIAGVRIELGEVEKAIRDAAGTDLAVALGWPPTSSGAAGIVGFVTAPRVDVETLRDRLKRVLPSVMVPREIRVLAEFPLNANGKVDRKALLESLRSAGPQDRPVNHPNRRGEAA